MTDPCDATRTLAGLIAADAPLRTGRAAALMLAVTEAAVACQRTGRTPDLSPGAVVLGPHGDVQVQPTLPQGDADPTGASIGRLLVALVTGRLPRGRGDALHLATSARLPPRVVSLAARSGDHVADDWPTSTEWHAALTELAGPHAAAPAPGLRAARRRRAVAVVAGLLLLAALSIVLVLAAMQWSGATGLVVPLLHGNP